MISIIKLEGSLRMTGQGVEPSMASSKAVKKQAHILYVAVVVIIT